MKIGYPCINRTLACQGNRTFRLRSYSPRRFMETVENNLGCLKDIVHFNVAHGILFFRITSDLIPFASHPVCDMDWQRHFRKAFSEIGVIIRSKGMRISMHPDQFTLINTPGRDIFERSVAELTYHCEVLDLLELDGSAKMQIHVGGVYKNRPESIRRFIDRFHELDPAIVRRLVIENDDRSYTVDECLSIHHETGIPVLFDVFHHSLLNSGRPWPNLLEACAKTWAASDGIPMMDYSSQEKGKRAGSHAQTLDRNDFERFLCHSRPYDFDLMLEIKDKEKSALRAIGYASGDGRLKIRE